MENNIKVAVVVLQSDADLIGHHVLHLLPNAVSADAFRARDVPTVPTMPRFFYSTRAGRRLARASAFRFFEAPFSVLTHATLHRQRDCSRYLSDFSAISQYRLMRADRHVHGGRCGAATQARGKNPEHQLFRGCDCVAIGRRKRRSGVRTTHARWSRAGGTWWWWVKGPG